MDLTMDDFKEYRRLQEEEEETATEGEIWEMVYVGVVLIFMFATLLSDKVGADLVMLSALTACMAGNIVTVAEGVSGFSNEGVLTVLVLFVVAAGVQLTGGLDWYMSKLLGRPLNAAGAQLRLMIPIAIISAFLNNTPVVVIMIPICQKWGKNVGLSPAQLLVPLSFASILGGTCTLIGTSTNLVVAGLLTSAYPDDPEMQMGLFDLGQFGVPIAFIGMSYIIIASPYLLPGGIRKDDAAAPIDDGTLLLGARLTKWSPAVGRTVKRSGLRDTGGVYLVSVYRARSGNIHRAVGRDFVLNVDDILYFTGMVQEFGQFCEDNGLEVVTNEADISRGTTNIRDTGKNDADSQEVTQRQKSVTFGSTTQGAEVETDDIERPPLSIDAPSRVFGMRSPIVLSAEAEKLQAINRLTDMIRGYNPSEPFPEEIDTDRRVNALNGPSKVVVLVDTQDLDDVVLAGVNTIDRPGLMLDISRTLHSLGLQLHHTEASVIRNRSISIWRCALIDGGADNPNEAEMQAVLSSMLLLEGGAGAAKQRGLPVIRCLVTDESRLCGKNLEDVNFRETYKAAIITVQKRDKSTVDDLTEVQFSPKDILVVQADADSPLLIRPPPTFYAKLDNTTSGGRKFFGGIKMSSSFTDLVKLSGGKVPEVAEDEISISSNDSQTKEVWRDLYVLFSEKETGNAQESGGNSREFLAAVEVSTKSEHIDKTVAQAGLDRQAGLFLVGVERRVSGENKSLRVSLMAIPGGLRTNVLHGNGSGPRTSVLDGNGSQTGSFIQGNMPTVSRPVFPEERLKEGDVLWFAGSATAIADLRKIPGLVSVEEDELKQINENVHDRRLVQAVVAKKGPLSGKTAGEVGFRTRYGAAVIAVHRDGTRVQDHPGNIKLQGGDVLLLEAGPTFISRNTDNQQSFALISEVKDSKPPRLDKLIPALVLVLVMLIIVAIGPPLFPEQNMSSLLVCGLVTAFTMVCFRILSQQECRDAINWEVYVTIACAFGIGKAMENSGLASIIADGLVSLGNSLGIGYAGLYGSVYLATFMISNIVTNNAAAALMFPIALDAAEQTGANRLLMSYNLMLAASASFMSPFGYTTNLLIYGPGGYKVKDFVYMGTPMQVILWIFTTAILTNTSVPWWVSWIWTFGVLVLVCLVFVFSALVKSTFKKAKDRAQDASH